MMVDREVMFGVLPGMDNRSDRHLPWLSLILYSAVQQRRRYTTIFDGTQRTTRPGNEPVENTSEYWPTSLGASRIRHHSTNGLPFYAKSPTYK